MRTHPALSSIEDAIAARESGIEVRIHRRVEYYAVMPNGIIYALTGDWMEETVTEHIDRWNTRHPTRCHAGGAG
jgi:hypothetical protein